MSVEEELVKHMIVMGLEFLKIARNNNRACALRHLGPYIKDVRTKRGEGG